MPTAREAARRAGAGVYDVVARVMGDECSARRRADPRDNRAPRFPCVPIWWTRRPRLFGQQSLLARQPVPEDAVSNPVDNYEEGFVQAVFAPLAWRIRDRIEISNEARMLDDACGIGIVAGVRRGRPPVGAE